MSPRPAAIACTALACALGACEEFPDHPTVHSAVTGPTFKQTGKIVDFLAAMTPTAPATPVPSATIAGNAMKATSDASGNYTLTVDSTKPFNFTVTEANSFTLVEADTILKKDFDRGNTYLLSNLEGGTLKTFLMMGGATVDATKALLSVAILKGSCPNEDGSTFDWSPKGSAQIMYIANGFPNPTRMTASGGSFPAHAVIFNLDVGPVTVNVTPPAGCEVAPFPYDDPSGIEYVSNTVKVQAGSTMTFLRLFFK
jgi:hypothetical protein